MDSSAFLLLQSIGEKSKKVYRFKVVIFYLIFSHISCIKKLFCYPFSIYFSSKEGGVSAQNHTYPQPGKRG